MHCLGSASLFACPTGDLSDIMSLLSMDYKSISRIVWRAQGVTSMQSKRQHLAMPVSLLHTGVGSLVKGW